MADKRKDGISLNTLNMFANAIEESLKQKEDAHKEELKKMAIEIKNMVDSFESAGFSHEDAMDIVKSVISGGAKGGNEHG